MLNKIIHSLIIFLFFSLALINSHLLDVFNIELSFMYLNGNYEFSKVLFFNILSGIIIFLFFLGNLFIITPPSGTPFGKGRNIFIPKIIFYLLGLILLSNIFSITPFTSLIGNSDKGHSSLMFINLIGLFIVFINLLNKDNNKIPTRGISTYFFKIIIFSTFILSLIGIKEFLLPTFDYGDLSNRALSTFGHPNYLALYLILIIPIVNNFLTSSKQLLQKLLYGTILFFIIIALFLTKSVWAIFLFFNYLFYLKYDKIKSFISLLLLFNKKEKYKQNTVIILIYLLLINITIIAILQLYPEKLSSFISRFYVWETVLNIIFSDIKIFIFGNGLSNLDLIFEGFKNKELYIFENYGFIADRPHNIFLNIFYSFGVIGLGLFGYLITKFYKLITPLPSGTPLKKGRNNKVYFEILVLFLLFNIFNFSSIASYLIIVFIIGVIHNSILNPFSYLRERRYNIFVGTFFILTSLFSIYFYSIYFLEENKVYNNSKYETNNILLKEINLENKEKTIFKSYYHDYNKLCEKLINNSNSAENYIYCGNLLYYLDKELGIEYYKLGLLKLPDLWDNDSEYYNNIFINKKNLQHRFFSEKYGNINIVLERVGTKK